MNVETGMAAAMVNGRIDHGQTAESILCAQNKRRYLTEWTGLRSQTLLAATDARASRLWSLAARAHRHNSQSAAPNLHSEPLTGTSGETEQHPDGTDCRECQPFHLIWNVLTAPWWLVIKQHIRSSTADSGGRSIGWRWGHWPPWLPLLLCWPARFGCF